jgi:Family of unknown function (DUF5670)
MAAMFLVIALVLLLAWAFAFVLFQVTVPYIHILLVLGIIFVILHRIFEWRG